MNPELLKKLRLPADGRALVLNAPADYLEGLGAQTHTAPDGAGPYPFVQLFVKDRAEFDALFLPAVAMVVYDGLFWLCNPKKTGAIASDLSRDIVWDLVRAGSSGLRPVMQISIDETWSALRFRPAEKVGG